MSEENENQTDAAPLDEELVDALDTNDPGYFGDEEEDEVDHEYTPAETPPRPAQPNRGPHKSSTQIAKEVFAGQGGEEGWQDRVEAAGYDIATVQHLVNRGVGRPPNTTGMEPMGRHAEQ